MVLCCPLLLDSGLRNTEALFEEKVVILTKNVRMLIVFILECLI